MKRWNGAVAYKYPFSKRTNVYGVAGVLQEKVNGSVYGTSGKMKGRLGNIDFDGTICIIAFGIEHRF